MSHALAIFVGRAAMAIAMLFPQVAPVADAPHRGPGIGAAMQPAPELGAADRMPAVDPLDLQVDELGAMFVIAPTVPAPKAAWTCIPDDASFLVIDGGARAILAPSRKSTWIIVHGSATEDGSVRLIYTEISTEAVVPPVVVPPNPDVPTPPVVPPGPSGARTLRIIRETAESTPAFTRLLVGLRTGSKATYLRDKGHVLMVLDDDATTTDGAPEPDVAEWRQHWQDLTLPALLITETTPTGVRLVHKQSLTTDANADGVIQVLKQYGG